MRQQLALVRRTFEDEGHGGDGPCYPDTRSGNSMEVVGNGEHAGRTTREIDKQKDLLCMVGEGDGKDADEEAKEDNRALIDSGCARTVLKKGQFMAELLPKRSRIVGEH